MFSGMTHKSVAAAVLGLAWMAAPAVSQAGSPVKLSGTIVGVVSDAAGIPQMGATVLLYNRQDRLFQKVFTNERGEFRFPTLFPAAYSVRVTLGTFFPAFRRDILVQPGMRSVLNVSLSSLFSTIQFSYPTGESGTLMSDEWKWVLRGSSATRPVLRFLDDQLAQVQAKTSHGTVFSDTRGVLRVSAGEGTFASGFGNQADLGTAFAVATALNGNLLEVSGNVGYGSATGVPAAAFRTSYRRGAEAGPEVSVTMRQLFLPERLGAGASGAESALPMLRTISAAFDDRLQLSDNVTLQYGSAMDSITFGDRSTFLSPYARLSYQMSDGEQLAFAYTSGNARPNLGVASGGESDLQRGLDDLGVFPNVSLRGGRPKVQRGQEFELTYSRKIGSRTYFASVNREDVSNAALSIVAPAGMYAPDDMMPDLFSGGSVFNAGDYQSNGYSAGVTQNVGERFSATVQYGSMGVLTPADRELVSNSPDELRSMIRAGRKHAATARVTATLPGSGTHLIASYQWTGDHRWAMPGNIYSTEGMGAIPGFNIYFRQPIPAGRLPWRMEATADFRNLLAQGYLPLSMANGQQVLLVETPRSFRGGLSFIF